MRTDRPPASVKPARGVEVAFCSNSANLLQIRPRQALSLLGARAVFQHGLRSASKKSLRGTRNALPTCGCAKPAANRGAFRCCQKKKTVLKKFFLDKIFRGGRGGLFYPPGGTTPICTGRPIDGRSPFSNDHILFKDGFWGRWRAQPAPGRAYSF